MGIRNFYISIFLLLSVWSFKGYAQNIRVDTQTYTPQQLVENIMINSGCIDNVVVTNVVGGNFQDGDKSYGYFSGNGSSFPFAEGVVLTTGKMAHVPGPNTTLSDDDALGWIGDLDLEDALGISQTVNATVLEFDFVPNADNISFRYIFASEEYQRGDPNTCRYSDAFAFLIKSEGSRYTNIALVPNTDTPVQVTTVHSGIPGHCPPINETYFEGWNGHEAPINFNGQTKALTATAAVVPNETYHIKLVIADHINYRYDSAVFLEGGSFNISANLGPDRSYVTNNPLCVGEVYTLDATPDGGFPLGYKWFRNGVLIPGEVSAQLDVSQEGVYKVEIDYGNDCIAADEVLIEYNIVEVRNAELYQCMAPTAHSTFYNLFDAENAIVNQDPTIRVHSFHRSYEDAMENRSPITNAANYPSATPDEVVYARAVSDYGCPGVAEVTLKRTTETVEAFSLVACSIEDSPGYASFDFSPVTAELRALFGGGAEVSYYRTYQDALLSRNPLPNPFVNTRSGVQTVYGRVSGTEGCLATTEVHLRVVNTPAFRGPSTLIYCQAIYPEPLILSSGLIGSSANVDFLWSTGATTPEIEVNEAGTYSVIVTRTQLVDGVTYSCENTRTLTVIESPPIDIQYTLTSGFRGYKLSVTVNGSGSYQYALDDGPYQESPVFENLQPGIYNLTVKDSGGCNATTIKVYILGFPKYFTPNDDGYHDYWTVEGWDSDFLDLEQVLIFDRFGKLIHSLDPNEPRWDGTYNGKRMPPSDYWYKAVLNDGTVHKGHFSLKR